MLKKLLGLDGKSGGFYLALDEDKSNQETSSTTSVATKPTQKAKTDPNSSTVPKAEPKKNRKTTQKTIKTTFSVQVIYKGGQWLPYVA